MGVVVSAGKAFTPAPAGVHQGVCCDVVDHGMVESTYNGETSIKHKVRLVWQIAELNDEGKPFLLHKRYTASLHEKASLRKELESWRGRPFTDQELSAFDLDNVLSVNALLNVVHATKDGNTYANVAAVMPIPKGTPLMVVAKDYIREQDRPKDIPQTQEASEGVPF